MISKDVASIIAKYNIPTIYLLSNDVGFKKYIATDNIEDYTTYLFDNRHSTQFSWVYNWFSNGFGYGSFLNDSNHIYNDYDQFKRHFFRNLQKVDIDYYKK